MENIPPTPAATLQRARRIGLDSGLHHVYTGNVHDANGGTTSCPHCNKALIVRDWYEIRSYELTADGCCPGCGTVLAGRFGAFGKPFGAHRIPVHLAPA